MDYYYYYYYYYTFCTLGTTTDKIDRRADRHTENILYSVFFSMRHTLTIGLSVVYQKACARQLQSPSVSRGASVLGRSLLCRP